MFLFTCKVNIGCRPSVKKFVLHGAYPLPSGSWLKFFQAVRFIFAYVVKEFFYHHKGNTNHKFNIEDLHDFRSFYSDLADVDGLFTSPFHIFHGFLSEDFRDLRVSLFCHALLYFRGCNSFFQNNSNYRCCSLKCHVKLK